MATPLHARNIVDVVPTIQSVTKNPKNDHHMYLCHGTSAISAFSMDSMLTALALPLPFLCKGPGSVLLSVSSTSAAFCFLPTIAFLVLAFTLALASSSAF